MCNSRAKNSIDLFVPFDKKNLLFKRTNRIMWHWQTFPAFSQCCSRNFQYFPTGRTFSDTRYKRLDFDWFYHLWIFYSDIAYTLHTYSNCVRNIFEFFTHPRTISMSSKSDLLYIRCMKKIVQNSSDAYSNSLKNLEKYTKFA